MIRTNIVSHPTLIHIWLITNRLHHMQYSSLVCTIYILSYLLKEIQFTKSRLFKILTRDHIPLPLTYGYMPFRHIFYVKVFTQHGFKQLSFSFLNQHNISIVAAVLITVQPKTVMATIGKKALIVIVVVVIVSSIHFASKYNIFYIAYFWNIYNTIICNWKLNLFRICIWLVFFIISDKND